MALRKKNNQPKKQNKKQKQRNQDQQIQPIRFLSEKASVAFLLEVHSKSDKILKQ